MSSTIEKTKFKIELQTPVQYLKGVGPARAEAFAQIGVRTAADLLEYFPRDWRFPPKATKINKIRADEPATIARMDAFATEHGYRLRGKHHEIYLGDPRRADPVKLKTVLRHPIESAV